eukprot:3860931-Rhodomonas_salina.3
MSMMLLLTRTRARLFSVTGSERMTHPPTHTHTVHTHTHTHTHARQLAAACGDTEKLLGAPTVTVADLSALHRPPAAHRWRRCAPQAAPRSGWPQHADAWQPCLRLFGGPAPVEA